MLKYCMFFFEFCVAHFDICYIRAIKFGDKITEHCLIHRRFQCYGAFAELNRAHGFDNILAFDCEKPGQSGLKTDSKLGERYKNHAAFSYWISMIDKKALGDKK
jgi:hypothetical protein